MMVIIYNNNHLCRIINKLLIKTQHNNGREGCRKEMERGEGEDKKGVEVQRRKEEEREGTKGERKITFCRVRGEREGEREKGRERE